MSGRQMLFDRRAVITGMVLGASFGMFVSIWVSLISPMIPIYLVCLLSCAGLYLLGDLRIRGIEKLRACAGRNGDGTDHGPVGEPTPQN